MSDIFKVLSVTSVVFFFAVYVHCDLYDWMGLALHDFGLVLLLTSKTQPAKFWLIAGEISRHMEHSGAKSIITIPSLVHKVEEAGIKV